MRRFLYTLPLFLSAFTAAFSAEQKSAQTFVNVDADADFLYLPIDSAAPYRQVKIADAAGKTLFFEPVMLAEGKGKWYAPVDVSAARGQKLEVSYPNRDMKGTPTILTSDSLFLRDYSADENRPKFHLAASDGLLGAFGGLFTFNGEYCAYVLSNPKSLGFDGTFGLSLFKSRDLLNWRRIDAPALLKSKITRPSSVCVDVENRSGIFSKGGILIASANSEGVFLAHSENLTDIGYVNSGSPVIKGDGGAPFIFFNKDASLWTILRVETEGGSGGTLIAFYASKDLKKWTLTDRIPNPSGATAVSMAKMWREGGAEPDAKWVLLSGNGSYVVGEFDGQKFKTLSAKRLNIFAGTVRFAQFWAASDSAVMASAIIPQPIKLAYALDLRFMNCASIPWKLSLVRVVDGEYQLRASLPEPFMEHIGIGERVADGMGFASNTFTLPNAYGNFCMFDGSFDITKETGCVSVEIGAGVFSYNVASKLFGLARLRVDYGLWTMPLCRDSGRLAFKAFVDSYSAEVLWGAGDCVVMFGDTFFGELQPVKVGGAGEVEFDGLVKYPVFRSKIKDLRRAADEIYKLKYGK